MIVDERTHVLKATLTEPFACFQAGKSGAVRSLRRSSARTAPGDRDEAFAPRARLTAADALAAESVWRTRYDLLRDRGQKGLQIGALSAVEIAL
jgi:hypothetical protein